MILLTKICFLIGATVAVFPLLKCKIFGLECLFECDTPKRWGWRVWVPVGRRRHPDVSQQDAALCCILVLWTGGGWDAPPHFCTNSLAHTHTEDTVVHAELHSFWILSLGQISGSCSCCNSQSVISTTVISVRMLPVNNTTAFVFILTCANFL